MKVSKVIKYLQFQSVTSVSDIVPFPGSQKSEQIFYLLRNNIFNLNNLLKIHLILSPTSFYI